MVTTSSPPDSSWLQDFQAASLARFESLGWPKRTDEHWRFADLKRGQLDDFDPASIAPTIKAPEGAQILALGDLPAERLQHLLQNVQGLLGSEKYIALAHAKAISGTCVVIPAGVTLEEPVLITHSVNSALAPVTLVLAEENSKGDVFERLIGEDEDAHLILGSTVVSAEAGSNVTYCLSQELNAVSRQVQTAHALVGRDANLQLTTANFGGDWIRQECVTELQYNGGNSEILALNICQKDQEIDQRTLQLHNSGQTYSNLLYKNALFDQSKAIFSGLIQVEEDAHYTDAFQSCRNLLLSELAEANAMPGLEINADQVKCSHGATSSQIDPEELFYLQARGIPEASARRLVTLGFLNGVIQQVKNSAIQEKLTQLLEAKLAGISVG